MGLLFSKLWAYFSHQERKLLLLGLDNSGKTTILYRLVTKEVVQTSPTLGSNVEQITYNKINFVMWDLGGQENLRSSWSNYYRDTEFVILVVDCSDRNRLEIVREELWRMLSHEDLQRAAVLILANKQDIKGCLTATELSQDLKLTAIKRHQWTILPCCALTGEGLHEALEWMSQIALKRSSSST